MRLSICPRNFQGLNGKYNTIEECMRLCADAGFTCFDFGIRSHIGSSFVYSDGWEMSAYELAEAANNLGCSYIQSHAPYAFSFYSDLEYYRELTYRSFRVAAILGAENIVIHGFLRPNPADEPDFDADLSRAYEFYSPFVELAGNHNMSVAVENLFNYGKKHIFTADVEEQLALIEKLGAGNVSACWDVGHANVRYGDAHIAEMQKLGSRISCTHIHDNLHSGDLHLPVFWGNIDWNGFMSTLKRLGYRGDLNFELRTVHLPERTIKDFLSFVHASGKCLISMYDSAEFKTEKAVGLSINN